MLSQSEQSELSSLKASECLYTVIGTSYTEERNAMLDNALKFLQETDRKINGPLIGRYLASTHSNRLDYYEI